MLGFPRSARCGEIKQPLKREWNAPKKRQAFLMLPGKKKSKIDGLLIRTPLGPLFSHYCAERVDLILLLECLQTVQYGLMLPWHLGPCMHFGQPQHQRKSEEGSTSEKNCGPDIPAPKPEGCNFIALGEPLKAILEKQHQCHGYRTSHNILFPIIKSAWPLLATNNYRRETGRKVQSLPASKLIDIGVIITIYWGKESSYRRS